MREIDLGNTPIYERKEAWIALDKRLFARMGIELPEKAVRIGFGSWRIPPRGRYVAESPAESWAGFETLWKWLHEQGYRIHIFSDYEGCVGVRIYGGPGQSDIRVEASSEYGLRAALALAADKLPIGEG